MSNLQQRIPFSEIFERIKNELVRDKASNASEIEAKYKGVVNDIYLTDFPLGLSEDLIRKTGQLTTKADYSTGTITIAGGGTSIVGASTAWTSALTNDSLLKGDGDTLYRVNYSSPTALTLVQPSTWIDDDQSADSYKLMFDRFALASDFSHMCIDDVDEPEVVYWYNNGNRQFLVPRDNGEYESKFQFNASTPSDYTVKWTNGVPYLHIWPCDDDARGIFYEYIPLLSGMTEYTTGTASCTNGLTAVTGTSTDWDGYLNTTDSFYFRFDGDGTGSDSVWYKISTYTGDGSITLASTYGGATKTAQPYTISRVSLYPAKYDTAIVYGAALRIDPNATDAARWASMYTMMIPAFKGRLGREIVGQRVKGKR